MSDEYLSSMQDDFSKVEESFKRELTAIRTGRASPRLLENVQVEVAAYGSRMPINQLATITAPDARLLVVNPWDKGTISDIEKGIMGAGLGLNPSNDGQVVRVPIPALTEERRRDMVKNVRKMLEDARVRARAVRRDYNDLFKGLQDDKEISEDDLKRFTAKVQDGTDACIQNLDALAAEKEKEVLEVEPAPGSGMQSPDTTMGKPPSERRLPRHVAIIMDGNGRWAESQGLSRVKGHEAGAESVREVVRASRELGIEALTLYSFSTENWRRPATEVGALMTLLHRYVLEERREILDQGIQLRAIGQINRLPVLVRSPLKALIGESSQNRGMVLNLALSYGSRAEIVDAVQSIASDVKAGRISPEAIDEALISSRLYTAGLPDPDLLIRTSGESRVSNFLLWQIAYAEIFVTDVLWPDFRRPHYLSALEDYAGRERRFGKTGQQLKVEG